ncbi:MAG: TlpA disulfide reductase family protein [Fimbriimonas sp.]|nr:TlpA disulfide reductase family protein [Fimbriimonas sp.]
MARTATGIRPGLVLLAAMAVVSASASLGQRTPLSPEAQKIEDTILHLRGMADADRAVATKTLAAAICKLPAGSEKVNLANVLANLTTEGDFGRDTLQEVTTTLDKAVVETPQPPFQGEPAFAYTELAVLARYEHMKVTVNAPDFQKALAKLAAVDKIRESADFTLQDISGKSWTLSSLKGKVVLVNFWATWCPPCRKEMPDMEALYNRFKDQGLIVLAISDETIDKVRPFIADHKYTYPILLDPGRKINTLYSVDGIPKSFIYNRKGKLAAQAIDMRTMSQFLSLLARAGLK